MPVMSAFFMEFFERLVKPKIRFVKKLEDPELGALMVHVGADGNNPAFDRVRLGSGRNLGAEQRGKAQDEGNQGRWWEHSPSVRFESVAVAAGGLEAETLAARWTVPVGRAAGPDAAGFGIDDRIQRGRAGRAERRPPDHWMAQGE